MRGARSPATLDGFACQRPSNISTFSRCFELRCVKNASWVLNFVRPKTLTLVPGVSMPSFFMSRLSRNLPRPSSDCRNSRSLSDAHRRVSSRWFKRFQKCCVSFSTCVHCRVTSASNELVPSADQTMRDNLLKLLSVVASGRAPAIQVSIKFQNHEFQQIYRHVQCFGFGVLGIQPSVRIRQVFRRHAHEHWLTIIVT